MSHSVHPTALHITMPSSTRSGAAIFPSGLTGKVVAFAKEGTGAPGPAGLYGLQALRRAQNAWLSCEGDKLYVRRYNPRRLELASWVFKKRGRGHATKMLAYLEEHLVDLPQSELYVESVHNERFADFFRRRPGWEEVPAFCSGCPPWGAGSPCFVFRGR